MDKMDIKGVKSDKELKEDEYNKNDVEFVVLNTGRKAIVNKQTKEVIGFLPDCCD